MWHSFILSLISSVFSLSGLPHGAIKSYVVTIAVLVTMVAVMAIGLFVLAILLLRTRRRKQYEPQIGNVTYVDVKKKKEMCVKDTYLYHGLFSL